MSTIIIAGGTGLIGKAITKALTENGDAVIILSRNPEKQKKDNASTSFAKWDPEKQEIDTAAIAKADYIIQLAGAGVADKRWTAKRKKEIGESRINSGTLLIKAIKETPNKIKAVISASAIGWYGPDPADLQMDFPGFTETAPHFGDFLGQTCEKWEASISPIKELNKRLVILRTGIVLSNEGGALSEFVKPLKLGFATILGNGKQVISWIHIDDLVRIYITAIKNEKIEGIYNAVAPAPVTNKELILKIAREKNKSFFLPVYVPAFVLKIVLGEMSIEVLKSATVSCRKIQEERFVFLYPSADAAIRQLAHHE